MKRILLLLVCILAGRLALQAEVVDANVCDVLAKPKEYDGKTVRLKGTVIADFERFIIADPNCRQGISGIWLDYPEGTKGKAGPVAVVRLQLAANSPGQASAPKRAAVALDKNQDFKQFDTLLSTPYKTSAMCLGCGRYTVKATLTGRLDGVAASIIDSDSNGKFINLEGFGNLNRYPARLVLQSIAEVQPQEIDYSKSASVTKGDSIPAASSGDPVAAAHAAAKAFGAGNSMGDLLEQAAAAFGKQGEDNGVSISFGTANELVTGEDEKGKSNSPDGLLFNCTFDAARLKGSALSKALAHVGTHIADYRAGDSHNSMFNLEFKAWQVTVVSAVATGQKTLTLSGGHVIWNLAWPPADRDKLMTDGVREALSD